jgi:hypothetical protein
MITKAPIGAEHRGKLRQLKAKLAKQSARIERTITDDATRKIIDQFALRGSSTGRARALTKLCRALGAGANLERVNSDGPKPLATWSWLKPRGSLFVGDDPTWQQDCIAVLYLIAGQIDSFTGYEAGVWTVAFTDHALGRLLQRSPGADPRATMLAAHRAILRARITDLQPCFDDPDHAFLLPATCGAFICSMIIGNDLSLPTDLREKLAPEPTIHAIAHTWLDADNMHDDQRPIAVDAGAGDRRIGDSFMLPYPLRQIVSEDDGTLTCHSLWGDAAQQQRHLH